MSELPRATLRENLTFAAVQALPTLLQGPTRGRPKGFAWSESRDTTGRAFRLVESMARRYGPRPVWIKLGGAPALLLLDGEDVRRVLAGSPAPFAADPPVKAERVARFEPEAATISRGEAWAERHAVNLAVLRPDLPEHPLAERIRAVCRAETAPLLTQGLLTYPLVDACFARIARRLTLGDVAADDAEVSAWLADLQSDGNRRKPVHAAEQPLLTARIDEYVKIAEPGSLVSLLPAPDGAGQVPHLLFALRDTVGVNTLRALACIAAHPAAYDRARVSDPFLTACVQETMRLFPTTSMIYRITTEDTDFHGVPVPAGTLVVIHNLLHHRGLGAPHPDSFHPGQWIDGGAATDWTYNHFSHGPQRCTGDALALLVATTVLRELLANRWFTLLNPAIGPELPLPYLLNHFTVEVAGRPLRRG